MADEPIDQPEADDAAPAKTKSEAKSAKEWWLLIERSRKAGYSDYDTRCDKVEKQYADAERLSKTTRSAEFQIFWANIQVLAPSIYSRPPVPVVTPRFKIRKPLQTTAAELLERDVTVTFETEDIDSVMRLVRDDLAINSRGVAWVRYEAYEREKGKLEEKICPEWLSRKDFLHDPARTWKEVDWVARCAWLTRAEARKRFSKSSGDAYQRASYAKRKDQSDRDDGRLKAAFWELWTKSQNKVVWISENVEVLLDEGEPHLKLENFFPCPRPAYGTIERNSLLPVPDYSYYQDQLAEINDLTKRISGLSDSLALKGFYPSGAGELGAAIQAALQASNDRQVLVGVSNWNMLGNGSAKDAIVWLPLDMVATTLTQLVGLRKQLIEDVYQISGLSDIMRGSTNPNETLGAQQLKSQYGSVRVRDRQEELVRLARDLTRIVAEIMAENYQPETLNEMSQMELPTDQDIQGQIAGIEQQKQAMFAELEQAAQSPEFTSQPPEQQKQAMEQVQQQLQEQIAPLDAQIAELQATVTIDQVVGLLRDQRVRPFVLDIETDSTIAPDENADKERANEFLTSIGGLLGQVMPLLQADPSAAPLVSETLKYASGRYRVGREMTMAIEKFAEEMGKRAAQPQQQDQGPSPEQQKAEADAKAREADAAAKQAEYAFKLEEQKAAAAAKAQEQQNKATADQAKSAADVQIANANAAMKQMDVQIKGLDLQMKRMDASQAGMVITPDGEGVEDKTDVRAREVIEAVNAGQQQTTEAITALGTMFLQTMERMAAMQSAPKMIIKDAQGRPVGVQTVQ